MWDFFRNLFTNDFMPHGHCYFWSADIVWLNVVSDALITLAYYSIPLTLIYFVRKRRDLPYPVVFLMFGSFIVACGTTHLMEIWTVWHGTYRLAGVIKSITAALSVTTAIVLVKLAPAAMALPSPADLAKINSDLQREISERKRAEEELRRSQDELELRVQQRTEALEQANTALRQSEERMRLVLDTALDAVVMIDAQGCISHWNSRAEQIFGWANSEAVGKTLADTIIPEQYRAAHEAGMRRYFATGSGPVLNKRIEITALHRSGREFPVELAITPAVFEDHIHFSAFIRDITERSETEELLRASEARFRATFEQAAVGIAHVAPDGHWLLVNQKLCDIVGYSREELLKLTFQEITHPDDLDADLELSRKLMAGTISTYSMEKRYVRKDGSPVWIYLTGSMVHTSSGAPSYALAVVEDISERKRSQFAAVMLAAIVESSSDAIVGKDLNGVVISWNAAATRMFGYTAQEMIGRSITQLIPPARRDEEAQILARLTRGEQVEPFETVRLRKDGGLIEVSVAVSPIKDANGKVIGASKVARDITERKRTEEIVKDSLREKETLLKEIHHRVKNNMQLISSVLQLQSGYISDPQALGVFRELQSRIRSMTLIHERLYQAASLAKIDFAEYVQSLVRMLMRTYHHSAQAVCLDVRIDPVSLNLETAIPFGLILNELISNCLKHAFVNRDRGCIIVSLQQSADGELDLTVQDDGIGLPANFDPEKSSSLGLRLIRILTEQLRGTLQIRQDRGTAITLKARELKTKERNDHHVIE